MVHATLVGAAVVVATGGEVGGKVGGKVGATLVGASEVGAEVPPVTHSPHPGQAAVAAWPVFASVSLLQKLWLVPPSA